MEDYSVLLEDNFRKDFLKKAIKIKGSQFKLASYLNSKLERRIIRENVKDWLNGKHFNGWDILMPISVLKEICLLNKISIDKVLGNAIKYNPSWKNPGKKKFLVKNNGTIILKKNNKLFIDLASILPAKSLESQRSRKELPLFCKIRENNIFLWSEACWKKSKIELRRYIELNDLFFKGCAIYLGEGTTKTKGASNISISFGNSEPSINNLFLKWLDLFLINYTPKYEIEYNGKCEDKTKIEGYWKLNICKLIDKINIRERVNYGSRLVNNRGVLKIRVNSTVLKAFVIKLLNVSKTIVLDNKEWRISYLKGLLASEVSSR